VSSRLVGFRSAYVFDIAQTDGQALPEFATVLGDPSQYLECLKVLVLSHAIVLDYDASLAPAKGLSRGGHITLLPNLPAAEEFCTLVHELAHEKLHRTERRKTIRETEADAVSFVVCRAIGLDTNTAAADYIHLYRVTAPRLLDPSSLFSRRPPRFFPRLRQIRNIEPSEMQVADESLVCPPPSTLAKMRKVPHGSFTFVAQNALRD
jgi:hypothetical protein